MRHWATAGKNSPGTQETRVDDERTPAAADPGRPERWRAAGAMARIVLTDAVRSFSSNRGLEAAATLAFYGILALMPMLLLLVFGLSLVMRSSEAVFVSLRATLQTLYPTFSDSIIGDLLTLAHQRGWGMLSILLLVWSTTPLTGAIRGTLEHTFRAEPRRSIWSTKAADVTAALALLGLFASLVGGTMVLMALRSAVPATGGPITFLVAAPGAWAGLALILLIVYRVFGGAHHRWGRLSAGAAAAAALMVAIRPVFDLFLRFNPDYGFVFGSLKTVFLLAIWIYYTFAVLLFGAEVTASLCHTEALVLRRAFTSQPGRLEVPGVLLMRFIRQADGGETLFREGDGGHEMFYIIAGEVALEKEGRTLARMGPGDYFGEMSMLLDQPRTATAHVVSAHARLLTIPRESFDLILRENPEIVNRMLREMAERLKATSEIVAPDAAGSDAV